MTIASSSPPSRLPLGGAEGARTTSRTRKAHRPEGRGDGRLAAVFIAPALLGFVLFLLWPTLRGIYLSFTRFNLLTPAEWVGLDNYDRMVHDPIFWDSLKVTVEYVVINIGVQTVAATWSPFTASAGWNYTNKARWGDKYQYDSKTFQSVVDWYFGLAEKGYLAPFTDYTDGANPANAQVAVGKAATAFDGAWMISTYYGTKGLDVGTALTPVGPSGKRATMMNGLADSITKNARNKEGAKKWVQYLASDECQKTVGSYGIVFPATPDGTQAAVAAYKKKGIDVSAFTEPVTDKEDSRTFSFPIADYAADVYALMRPAMQDVYANGAPVSGLTKTNDQINFILGQ